MSDDIGLTPKQLMQRIWQLEQENTALQLRTAQIVEKWRGKNQALAQELQLAQVGLSSGCGCPIGQCQREKADARPDGSSCWLQWAESHLARRMADIRISELQRHAVHPSRFAGARAEGKTVQRLASIEPDADGIVREPGIEGTCRSSVTVRKP